MAGSRGMVARWRQQVAGWGLASREARLGDLASYAIAGPLQFTARGLYVWYVLSPLSWDFLTLDQRSVLWDQATYRLGRLAETGPVDGRPFRVRVTTRPYPSYEFAQSLDEDTASPLPTVPGGESWADYLARAQLRLQSTGLDQRLVMVGVWVSPPVSADVRHELTASSEHPGTETVKLLSDLADIDRVMTGAGFSGHRATGRDMAFLMHRSLSMGIPVPSSAGIGGEGWEASDLAEFTERRAWAAEPFGRTVQVVSEVGGRSVQRWCAVLSMGVMPDLHWPDSGTPWMVATASLPFGVEWSLSGLLQRSKALEATVAMERLRAEDVALQYAEHQITPPPAVARAVAGAAANLDEITEGDSRTAGRWTGVIRAAVYGATEDEALERARLVRDLYEGRLNVPLVHTLGQPEKLREFIPGETWSKVGFQRRLPVKYLAAAMPNVDSEVGTPTGAYLGYGSGTTRRAVRFDPHYAMEVLNRPGLVTITGEQGSGKSVLIGTLAYHAVRRGEPTCINDPSGPLARLAELPELAPFSRVLDMNRSGPGTLSAYGLIPDPRPDDFDDEQEFQTALRYVRGDRQQLLFDQLRMLLSAPTQHRAGVEVELVGAIRAATAHAAQLRHREAEFNSRWVLDHLAGQAAAHEGSTRGELLRLLHEELAAAADYPKGGLLIPDHRDPIRLPSGDDALLVVVTMPGVQIPPEGTDQAYWSMDERLSVPLLHSATIFASRFIYERPASVRKNFFGDETHFMAAYGSGRAFTVRGARDSRKRNTAFFVSSQHPDDHLGIGKLDGLMGAAFVGRLTDHDTAVKACRLLGCAPEYAPVIEALSAQTPGEDDQALRGATGEFVFRDPSGRVGKIRVDRDWHPSLKAALDTTPGPRRPARVAPAAQPAPFIDPELLDPIPRIEEEVA
ncbi:MAG: ATP-binding protein [Propionicimonas sp.]